jgi:hypothetical protein
MKTKLLMILAMLCSTHAFSEAVMTDQEVLLKLVRLTAIDKQTLSFGRSGKLTVLGRAKNLIKDAGSEEERSEIADEICENYVKDWQEHYDAIIHNENTNFPEFAAFSEIYSSEPRLEALNYYRAFCHYLDDDQLSSELRDRYEDYPALESLIDDMSNEWLAAEIKNSAVRSTNLMLSLATKILAKKLGRSN